MSKPATADPPGIRTASGERKAGRRLDEIQSEAAAVTLVTAEKEELILNYWAADRSSELVERKRALIDSGSRIFEEISRVQSITPQVLKYRAVEMVTAGLRNDADLAASTGSELSRKVARIDAKLLHVLEAGLEPERRWDLSIKIART